MQDLFSMVLTASFWGSVFTAVVLVLNKIFNKKIPPFWHYYIWVPVILRFLIPMTITLAVTLPQSPISLGRETTAVQELQPEITVVSSAQYPDEAEYTAVIPQVQEFSHNSVQKETSPASVVIDAYILEQTIAVIWFSIAILLILKTVIAYSVYMKKIKENIMPVPEHWASVFNKISYEMGGRGKTAFYMGQNIDSPFTMGIFNQCIILPDRNYKAGQIEMILRHELTHIKRQDILFKLLSEIVGAIHWFNPFAYIMARQVEYCCEVSCDAEVLKNSSSEERVRYALTIMDTISCTLGRKPVLSLSVTNRKKTLKSRISEVLESRTARKNTPLVLVFTAVLFAACACSAVKITEKLPDTRAEISLTVEEEVREGQLSKERINILGAGFDDTGFLTDVLMVINIDFTDNKITVLSIPRDTYLNPTDNFLSQNNANRIMPGEIKISEVTFYALEEEQLDFLKYEVENLLDISIDYTIAMNMEGFEKIIDVVGGVEMEIEQDMYYLDPTQELTINLKAGKQVLDGESALHFVRYRAYPQGDLDRITKQQELLQALFKAVINDENRLDNLPLYLRIFMEEVETDMSLTGAMALLPLAADFSETGFETGLLPGNTEVIDVRNYYILDIEKFNSDFAHIFK